MDLPEHIRNHVYFEGRGRLMSNYDWVTDEMFDNKLQEITQGRYSY